MRLFSPAPLTSLGCLSWIVVGQVLDTLFHTFATFNAPDQRLFHTNDECVECVLSRAAATNSGRRECSLRLGVLSRLSVCCRLSDTPWPQFGAQLRLLRPATTAHRLRCCRWRPVSGADRRRQTGDETEPAGTPRLGPRQVGSGYPVSRRQHNIHLMSLVNPILI